MFPMGIQFLHFSKGKFRFAGIFQQFDDSLNMQSNFIGLLRNEKRIFKHKNYFCLFIERKTERKLRKLFWINSFERGSSKMSYVDDCIKMYPEIQ